MSWSLDKVGMSKPGGNPMRLQFLRWQCRVRQIAMREKDGRPDDTIMPAVILPGDTEPMGQIITVISKSEPYSKTPELMHMVKRTNDPAQRREKALQLFSETYYQKASEFSDQLTATFQPGSEGAASILDAGGCTLAFAGYGERYELSCRVEALDPYDPLYQATWWHNALFNPNLSADVSVLSFNPDWRHCVAEAA